MEEIRYERCSLCTHYTCTFAFAFDDHQLRARTRKFWSPDCLCIHDQPKFGMEIAFPGSDKIYLRRMAGIAKSSVLKCASNCGGIASIATFLTAIFHPLPCQLREVTILLKVEGATIVKVTMEHIQNGNTGEVVPPYPRARSMILLGTGTSGMLRFAVH
jgi:hypothetical protein